MSSKDSLFIGRLKRVVLNIFKIMNDLSPVFQIELFTKKIVPYDLRNDYVFDIPMCNTVTYGINSLCYQDMKLWGSLDSTV